MIWRILKWIGVSLLAGLTLLVASSCTMLGLNYASLDTANKPDAVPPLDVERLLTPDGRAEAMAMLEDTLYGPWPQGLAISMGDWRIVNADYLDGRGTLEERDITIGEGDGARTFKLIAAFPRDALSHALVISQTFSSNCSVFPGQAISGARGAPCTAQAENGFANFLITNLFGEFIAEAPVGMYFDAGLAYASFHAGDFIPDSTVQAPAAMSELGAEVNPTSTLMAWAFAFSATIDAFENDPRVDPAQTFIMGHSRHGKSALLAAVWDRRVEGVVAHQSGFAGASLSRSPTGERLDRMAKTYPHWLAPGAQAYASNPDLLPFDQHLLVALVAPHRVLLGNARRDVWSDPNSSYRAAQAASDMWSAYGATGLTGDSMRTFDPSAGIAWWLRVGGHSVIEEDITTFIRFVTAAPGVSAASPASELPSTGAPR